MVALVVAVAVTVDVVVESEVAHAVCDAVAVGAASLPLSPNQHRKAPQCRPCPKFQGPGLAEMFL